MMDNHDFRSSTPSFFLSAQHDHLVTQESKSLSSDVEDHLTKRHRRCTRRKLLILILLPIALIVLVFAVIFFPVYFTRDHSKSSTASPTVATDSNATQTRKSRTTQGAVWKQASNFKDLNDFGIEYYSSGQANSQVLTGGLPSSALRKRTSSSPRASTSTSRRPNRRQASATTGVSEGSNSASIPTNGSTSTPSPCILASQSSQSGSVLSILYPANSYTPSAQPVGGTQFYALTPFDLSLASSITFNYSAFFPANYDFVMGGKLPGLYGGTEGCGGGNDASDCWSTRMAWRKGGMGELYAYLPQDRQNVTAMLEVPPYSYVNSDYGISLGRGAFNYTTGGWTTISQTITLSSNKTHPNGIVDITVNDVEAIRYDQVYWPTSIKGILFSTFFGGATKDWATPVDQHSYFKDFSVRINSLRNITKS